MTPTSQDTVQQPAMTETAPTDRLVLGVDIGTTGTKVVAYDPTGQALAHATVTYPLESPQPGYAEQDPEVILEAVRQTVREVLAELRATDGREVAGLAFSSAMHSLIGLDAEQRPITPSTTWADTRADAQAERLRQTPEGLALHRRTGTPVHPMSPLVRLVWFREEEPETHRAVVRWCGIKEYVLLQLSGALVMDLSIASCSGLLDIHQERWDDEALALAGITAHQLPEVVPTTHVLTLLDHEARGMGLATGTALVVGAGDGPLANLGVGAVRPGMVACSLGTSGALRVVVDTPVVDPSGRVFCYALAPGLWVVGGAINNGGIVMRWALDALAPDLGEGGEEALLELAATAPAGSGGLLMLPYLLSERAPRWSSLPQGVYVGLNRTHSRQHMVRATIEGVCLQLSLVLDSMRDAGLEITTIRATGGVVRSPLWRQVLADTLATPIDLTEGQEGSSFGAAILGLAALGIVDSIEQAGASATVVETVEPDPASAAVYARLRPVFAGLYDALVPTFEALREIAPELPEA